MIQAIDKKYCIGNLVQLMPYTDACHFIVSTDEIILLKVGDKVLVNKYVNHPNRNLFPYHEKEKNDWLHFTELFEYNKTYLNFRGSVGGFRFHKDYFFKGSDRALWLEESLPVDERYAIEDSVELDRYEIEKIFDSSNYDSMYVIDIHGRILFARNDKDKIHIGKNVIPSDNEIIEMELRSRKGDYNIARIINPENDTTENYQKVNTLKKIDEIRNFKVYGPALFRKYSDMLLTVKDDKFDLKWFRIDFIEKDKFRLTSSPISIVEPTIDDVINFSSDHEIETTSEPTKPIPSFEQVHTLENQKMAMDTVNSIIDCDEQQKPEKSQKSENGVYKRLRKLFKNNSTGSN